MRKIKLIALATIAMVAIIGCGSPKPAMKTVERKNDNIETSSKPKIHSINSGSSTVKTSTEKKHSSNEKGYEKYIAEHYAELLKTTTSYIKKSFKLYSFIDMWLGTPYRYGGNSMNGTDCSGLAQTFYKEIYKIDITRDAGSQFKECDVISNEDLMEGDLVFFKIGSKFISHVGIYLGNNKFFHASSKGVMISDLTEKYYAKYFFKSGRLKNNLK